MSSPPKDQYKLVYTVPQSHLEATKKAIFEAGSGIYGEGKYTQTCFEWSGVGQFLPMAAAGANPQIGKSGVLEKVAETRIETLCIGKDVTQRVVAALKKAHPYEETVYEVYKIEDF